MIRHTVVFRLKHPKGSAAETKFLADAMMLAKIPGVEKFEQLRQVSPKNDYHFGFSMEFTDQEAYSGYNDHPHHVASCATAGYRRSNPSSRSTTCPSSRLV